MRTIRQFDFVVRVLGGPSKVARICKRPNPEVVHNWRRRGHFPPVLFPPMQRALKRKRWNVDPQLFRFEQADDVA
jgi:hypothetical protein